MNAHSSRTLMILGLAALSCAACVSTETDPARVTWGDLSEGKRLEAYLESRRADLTKLETEAQSLSAQLSRKEAALDSVDVALAAAEKDAHNSDAELSVIRQELTRANAQLTATRAKAAELQTRIATLRANLMQLQDKRAAQEQIALSEVQLKRLQGEVEMLERTIERTLLVRARHALQIADL